MISINVVSIDKDVLYKKLENEKERLNKLAYEKELRKKLLKDFQIRFSYLNYTDINIFIKYDSLLPKKDIYDIAELLYFGDLDFVKHVTGLF